MFMQFQLTSPYQPAGDQPKAIAEITKRINTGKDHTVLLGVTGSGKTFTMANVIQNTQKPTLVIAHNKTLAAQLYQEFRDFFPNNAVSYFVSYYDYYQPEAYIPTTDTYIEKEATINDEIDKLRLATTTNLLTRQDVIVVASVSCIYNLGSPVEYGRYILRIVEGEVIAQETLLLQLANLQYDRSDNDLRRGTYRLRGDSIQIWPAYEDIAIRVDTLENRITRIDRIDPISGNSVPKTPEQFQVESTGRRPETIIYPAKHYVIDPKSQKEAMADIRADLATQTATLKAENKVLEAYRIEQKVNYDLEMIQEFGFTNGIENYSRYFDGREPGDPPFTLLDYFAENARLFNHDSFLTVVDESHITVPQVGGMYAGDRSRKETLIQYGFRLPSALDNRPLQFPEFESRIGQAVYVSATPNEWETKKAGGAEQVVEQLIRPTGLVDPIIELRKTEGQVEDLIVEVIRRKAAGQRTLVTTLTKKMAEALTEYLNSPEKIDTLLERNAARQEAARQGDHSEDTIWASENIPVEDIEIGPIPDKFLSRTEALSAEILASTNRYPKVAYLHSDIETLERSDILDDLRRGVYDVVVGINLLREGLDLPEVTLVAILDADKEGFLRSRTSMIQTMGRAARHSDGRAILYADRMTKSMKAAIGETQRRRAVQVQDNLNKGLEPITISKPIRDKMIKDENRAKNNLGSKSRGKGNRYGKTEAPPEEGMVINLNKNERLDLSKINASALTPHDKKTLAAKLKRRMSQAAKEMDFELAVVLRDIIATLR
jgi:excinuclease ABC subunit B